jgi:hypothetical protein
MRWTRLWQLTSAAIADGEVVWSWHPGADAKSRCFDEYRGRRGQERRSPGRSRISRKPFAQGRPDYPAEPVVPAPCIFSHGGRGYQRIPGLPCPLFSFGGSSIGNARVHMCREDGEACLNCEARTQLHIQPSSPAKAGDPVRGGVPVNHNRLGILGRPVKPGDDSGEWSSIWTCPCERSDVCHIPEATAEAIQSDARDSGLLRRVAPRSDEVVRASPPNG